MCYTGGTYCKTRFEVLVSSQKTFKSTGLVSSCVAEKLENEEMMRREQRKVWVAKLRKQQNSCGVLGLPRWCLVVKNPPAKPRDLGDADSIPGLGRSPGGGHGTHSSIPAWGIPRTDEPCILQSMVLQSWTQMEWLSTLALWSTRLS